LMTFPTRTMNASMLQIHKELEEAASVNGAGWFSMFTRITMPLLTPAMVSVWVWAALISMREVSSALMLSGPNSTVLSVVIWNQWTDGGIPQASALGIIMLALGAVIMFLGRFIGFKIARRGKM
jgi:iron(III) transport system permease protein